MTRLSQKTDSQDFSRDPMAAIPWKVGGQYRVLEKLQLRESVAFNSKKTQQLPVGTLVEINEISMLQCQHLGWCPCAKVSAHSSVTKSKLKERRGWIRCAGKDGRNLIDERDQLEFEKVTKRMRESGKEPERKVQISPHPPSQREIGDRNAALDSVEEDYEDWDDEYSEEYYESEEEEEGSYEGDSVLDAEEAPGSGSATSGPAAIAMKEAPAARLLSNPEDEDPNRMRERDFAKKLQAMEIGAKEEKLVDTNTIITDKSACWDCNCGAARSGWQP